ncbi:hypothetical protein PPYR_13620 [Photinus pyralis]|uniref:Peptidase S1 domain-containing protein n=1 Tax=Photinus pyralis TaxID=7054 RepID=A0A5N4A9J8_PHOPY|nr:mast cell protease 1-like [Photinus pyralis]KAB0794000.1 hypothetical protein PPYR_13620 [Photinus pyralis]
MALLRAILLLSIGASVSAVKVAVPSLRIAGGEVAEKHSIPYQADLIVKFPESETLFRTGTLISPTYVLTAANCVVDSSNITVIMGVYNVEDKKEPTRRKYKGVSYTAHPLYNADGLNDIAVVRLNQSAEINEYIQVALLPRYSYLFTKPLIGKVAKVSGWGNVDGNSDPELTVLRFAEITIRHHTECRSKFPRTNSGQLCGTDPERYFEISDIGAPLVLGKVQVGIAAATTIINGTERSPQIYTRIDRYLLWIGSNTDVTIEL